jgi:hypothetical protein
VRKLDSFFFCANYFLEKEKKDTEGNKNKGSYRRWKRKQKVKENKFKK